MVRPRRLKRGIYLLPTLFTVGNLFCGYMAVIQASSGQIEQAALLIVLAALVDGLDGRIARLTGSTSAFGMEFDSLADIVSFGLAPALLCYRWALGPLGRLGWLVAFLYVVCAAMRLARFNIRALSASDKRYFAGLPTPMGGILLACAASAFPLLPATDWLAPVLAAAVFGVALLMISRLRYRSFKEFNLRARRSYVYVLPVAAILVGIAFEPKFVLLLLSAAYVLSAPAVLLWNVVVRGRAARPEPATDEPAIAEQEVADEPLLR